MSLYDRKHFRAIFTWQHLWWWTDFTLRLLWVHFPRGSLPAVGSGSQLWLTPGTSQHHTQSFISFPRWPWTSELSYKPREGTIRGKAEPSIAPAQAGRWLQSWHQVLHPPWDGHAPPHSSPRPRREGLLSQVWDWPRAALPAIVQPAHLSCQSRHITASL